MMRGLRVKVSVAVARWMMMVCRCIKVSRQNKTKPPGSLTDETN